MHGTDLWIWIIGLGLNIVILEVLRRTDMWRVIPSAFTMLISFAVISALINPLIRTISPYGLYRYVYAAGELGDLAFQLYAIFELGLTTNRRTRWIGYSLWIYFVLEGLILIQTYFVHFGRWYYLTHFIQPLYIGFQISWIWVIWSINNKVTKDMKGETNVRRTRTRRTRAQRTQARTSTTRMGRPAAG